MCFQVFIFMDINIYYLTCPLTNEIRYIGQTKFKLQKRLRSHIQEARRYIKYGINPTRKNYWIASLIRDNKENDIKIHLIENCDISEVDQKEIYWIGYYKSKSDKITNTAIGGRTSHLSDESKKKIGLANKGEKNGMFGKRFTRSPEDKERTRLAMINSEKFQKSRKSDEYRHKISMVQQIDDWLLLDINLNIINIFATANDVAKFLGCKKINVLHARSDMRKVCKNYWVVYKKDYDRFLQISKNVPL